MNLFSKFDAGLPYEQFIAQHGTPPQAERWRRTFEQCHLTDAQKQLLASFTREIKVLVLAGVWCGDCANQCPIFERFAQAAPVLRVRYIDRDVHADAQRELQINGGNRVPVAVFFSEDGHEVSRLGERTLSKYRELVQSLVGGCPTGHNAPGDPVMVQVIQEWLNEFERVHCLLRLSPRLRQKHGD